MSEELAGRACVPCRGGVAPLKGEPLNALAAKLPRWRVENELHLTREFKFKNFADALAFVNRVGAIAEEQNHHPNIALSWGRVQVDIWTHKIDGLTESDFIFAAKVDQKAAISL